jgi:hypothetical protein
MQPPADHGPAWDTDPNRARDLGVFFETSVRALPAKVRKLIDLP